MFGYLFLTSGQQALFSGNFRRLARVWHSGVVRLVMLAVCLGLNSSGGVAAGSPQLQKRGEFENQAENSRQANPYVQQGSERHFNQRLTPLGTQGTRVLPAGAVRLAAGPESESGEGPGESTWKSNLQEDVTEAEVERLEQELQLITDIDPSVRESIAKSLSDARGFLQAAKTSREKQQRFEGDARKADEVAREIQRDTAQLKNPDLEQDLSSRQIGGLITDYENQIDTLRSELQELENEPTLRQNRELEINARLTELQSDLTKTIEALAKPVEGESNLATRAGRLLLRAKQQALKAENAELRAERTKYESERNTADKSLIALRIEEKSKRQALLQALVEDYEKLRQKRLAEEKNAEELEAERSRRNKLVAENDRLKRLSAEFEAWLETRVDLTEELEQARQSRDAAEDAYNELESEFSNSRKRVNEVGLNSLVGQRLRSEKARLVNRRSLWSSISANAQLAEQIQSRQFDLIEQREQLKRQKEAIIREAQAMAGQQDPGKLREAADTMIESQLQLMQESIRSHREYVTALTDLYVNQRKTVELSRQYLDFINERILWIRSNEVLFSQWQLDAGDRPLARAATWQGLLARVMDDVWQRPVYYLFSLSLGAVLILSKPRFRNRIQELGEAASRGTCTDFKITLRTLLLTFLLAAGVPIIGSTVGISLVVMRVEVLETTQPGAAMLVRAVGWALLTATWVYFPMELLRYVCRPQGLAVAHFRWQNSAIAIIRGNLKWSTHVAAALSFVIALMLEFNRKHEVDLVDRSTFFIGMLLLTFLFWRIFNPREGVFKETLASHSEGWVAQTRAIWFGAILAIPLTLAVLVFIGYYYTASVLVMRVYAMLVLLFAVVILRELMMRFLLLRRRELHIQQARARREALAAERDATGETEVPSELAGVEVALAEVDFSENLAHSRKLLTVSCLALACIGTWWIWVDVLPAVKMLDQYQVWPSDALVADAAGAESSAAGDSDSPEPGGAADVDASRPAPSAAKSATPQASIGVTYRDLLLALLIAMVTIGGARNLPGLMEMVFLKQLPVDQSIRHAFKSIVSYIIIVVGAIMTFRALKIGWGQVQWLVTALTFGLAFGLQEIFANFVAGIILLFERPLRIGDIVTVDDVTGVVSRIRTRATTITNWDRQEYVIPNKEFITGRMLNWTLTDKVNRVVINVGVAYGSDLKTAKELLHKICGEQEVILKDPPPMITFEAFGDSSLTLVLRAFLPDMDNRLSVVDQLHSQINEEFSRAGIEIPFPQRDIHVRTLPSDLSEVFGSRNSRPSQSSDDAAA